MAKNCEEYVLEQLEKKDADIEELKKEKENLILEIKSLKNERRNLLLVARVFAAARTKTFDGFSIELGEDVKCPYELRIDYARATEIINEIDFGKEVDFINGKID